MAVEIKIIILIDPMYLKSKCTFPSSFFFVIKKYLAIGQEQNAYSKTV